MVWNQIHLVTFLRIVSTIPTICVSYASADAILNPNQISGNLSFTNQNTEITNVLSTSGVKTAILYADSQGLSQVLNNKTTLRMESSDQFDFQMTVESSNEGITYSVRGDLRMDNNSERYFILPAVSNAVFPEPVADTLLNIEQCAAMVDLNFVTAEGFPVDVTGGQINAWKIVDERKRLQAQDFGSSGNFNQDYLLIEGDGSEYHMQVIYSVGDDIFVDKIRNMCQFSFNASCDQVIPIDCVIEEGTDLGNITGNISVEGEELVVANGLTQLLAYMGPYQNYRIDHVAGEGVFNLQNLVPTNVVAPEQQYAVLGRTAFGSGNNFQYLQTPIIRTSVYAGETSDLDDAFDLIPGYITGSISLNGPANSTNALQYISRDSDYDRDGDGIPNNVYINKSRMEAYGMSMMATGATQSAYGGRAKSIFDGEYDSETARFTGSYHMALSGPAGDPSIWSIYGLFLEFNNTLTRNAETDPYHNAKIQIKDNQLGFIEVLPRETQEIDVEYCFNEVELAYSSQAGSFYRPDMHAIGRFDGEDYRGQLKNYTTTVSYARGLPDTASGANNVGSVNLTLPQGYYDITPKVTTLNPDGSETDTELPEINLDMGCGQVIRASTDIQVSVGDVPSTTEENTITISGEAKSGSVVNRVEYVKNSANAVTVCNSNCATDGTFSAEVPLDEGENHITLTAHTEEGSRASVSVSVESAPQAPEEIAITQCNDIRAISGARHTAVVEYDPVVTGGCSIPQLTCNIESGSELLIGNYDVSCRAVDTCEQEVSCDFKIAVRSPYTVERSTRTETLFEAQCERETSEEAIIDSPVIEHPTDPAILTDEEPDNISESSTTPDSFCEADPSQPVISGSSDMTVLWSPNHELMSIGYQVSINHCDHNLKDSLTTEVYSDEQEVSAQGSGDFAIDALMTEQGLALRAEREGNSDGRVYLILSQVEDSEGETYTSCSTVVVTKDQSSRSLRNVLSQANEARIYCKRNAEAPESFFRMGESESFGPKQTVVIQPKTNSMLNVEKLSLQSEIVFLSGDDPTDPAAENDQNENTAINDGNSNNVVNGNFITTQSQNSAGGSSGGGGSTGFFFMILLLGASLRLLRSTQSK